MISNRKSLSLFIFSFNIFPFQIAFNWTPMDNYYNGIYSLQREQQ